MGLPHHIDQVDYLRPVANQNGTYFAAVTSDEAGKFDARVVDDEGNVYLTMSGYRTMQLPTVIDEHLLRPLKGRVGDKQNG